MLAQLTIEIFCREFKKAAITFLDTDTKDMTSTWAFLDHIYQELIDTSDKVRLWKRSFGHMSFQSSIYFSINAKQIFPPSSIWWYQFNKWK